jgi:hypothetical protein
LLAKHQPAITPGALSADIVTALRNLAEMIKRRLRLRPLCDEQSFAVECRGEDLAI